MEVLLRSQVVLISLALNALDMQRRLRIMELKHQVKLQVITIGNTQGNLVKITI